MYFEASIQHNRMFFRKDKDQRSSSLETSVLINTNSDTKMLSIQNTRNPILMVFPAGAINFLRNAIAVEIDVLQTFFLT